MLDLLRPSLGLQLVRWSKELPSSSALDPLGLNLRLGARLSEGLLHCITSITPRARYFSFFPWAFEDYFRNERGQPGDRGLIEGVVARERALVLGSIMHHEGGVCEGGALAGSDKAQGLLSQATQSSYNLAAFKHLKQIDGVFGQAYKASLVNLRLFDNPADEVSDEINFETNELTSEAQAIEVRELSERGRLLADAFNQAVCDTRYVREQWSCRVEVDADVLREFGSRGGLCEILLDRSTDRSPLRAIFFHEHEANRETAHYRRRMSLLLMLSQIDQLSNIGALFDRWSFSDLAYFRAFLANEADAQPVRIEPSSPLTDTCERWRIFHYHSYLTLGLQTFAVAVVRLLRDKPAGIDRHELLDQLDHAALTSNLEALLKRNLPQPFFDMTPAQTLDAIGVNVPAALRNGPIELVMIGIDAPFSERGLERLLLEQDAANETHGVALAAILLYCIMLRYQISVAPGHDAWCRNHVQDAYSDISLPGVLDDLRRHHDDRWWQETNRSIIDRLIWRFVLLQHQTMSYERGSATAPLFHVDGARLIGAGADYTDPSPPNARLPSALRILIDLGLVQLDESDAPHLTDDGHRYLQQQLDLLSLK